MLGYWINDLPLPSPANQYRWAKDPALLVSFFVASYEQEMRQSIPQKNRKRKYSLKKKNIEIYFILDKTKLSRVGTVKNLWMMGPFKLRLHPFKQFIKRITVCLLSKSVEIM